VVARGEHLEAMRRDGIRLLHGSRTITGRVRAAAEARELGAQDAVFVTLKANLLRAFAAQCAPLLGRDTAVVFVQNGIPWWYDERLTRLDPDRALRWITARSELEPGQDDHVANVGAAARVAAAPDGSAPLYEAPRFASGSP